MKRTWETENEPKHNRNKKSERVYERASEQGVKLASVSKSESNQKSNIGGSDGYLRPLHEYDVGLWCEGEENFSINIGWSDKKKW